LRRFKLSSTRQNGESVVVGVKNEVRGSVLLLLNADEEKGGGGLGMMSGSSPNRFSRLSRYSHHYPSIEVARKKDSVAWDRRPRVAVASRYTTRPPRSSMPPAARLSSYGLVGCLNGVGEKEEQEESPRAE